MSAEPLLLSALGISVIGAAAGMLSYIRKRQYKYDPRQDYRYSFENSCDLRRIDSVYTIDLSEISDDVTLILEINVKSRLSGHLFQPYIEMRCDKGERENHYLEHALMGLRYLDISRFRGSVITLKPRHCRFLQTQSFLYRYDNPDLQDKTVLILAPHADDAEIAAYGLYSTSAKSHIITVTVGEEGKCDYCGLSGSKRERALLKGKLRVHDALSVPALGDVPYERCAMLGYYGKSLKWMHDNPDKKALSATAGIDNLRFFRRVEHTSFLDDSNADASWGSLVNDLHNAVTALTPDIIVTPHPEIDSHSDHVYTTYALIEALERSASKSVTLLCYTNHHIYNEAYPYGPMFSTSAVAPKFKTPFGYRSIYSHRLEKRTQNEKFYALEAMHDLRDATLVIGVKKALKHFTKQLKRAIQQRDKSYFRRAVRPNELFYVTGWESLSRRSKSSRIERGENGAIEES